MNLGKYDNVEGHPQPSRPLAPYGDVAVLAGHQRRLRLDGRCRSAAVLRHQRRGRQPINATMPVLGPGTGLETACMLTYPE